MHGVSRLHSVRQWEIAQKKMKEEMKELPTHFWSYYFPDTPSFGFSSKPAGLVQSTNGLERMWRTLKGMKKLSSSYISNDINDLFKCIEMMESTIFGGKMFSTSPKVDVLWYDKIAHLNRKDGLGHDLLCNTFYDSEKGFILSGKALLDSSECMKYVCYMPTDLLFSMVKAEVEKAMTFTFNDNLSLSGSLLLQQKLNHFDHTLTESLSFRVKIMRGIGEKLSNHSIYTAEESLIDFLQRNAMREKRVWKKNVQADGRKKKNEMSFDLDPRSDLNGPLGWFYKVTVDRCTKKIECNCECFNTWASCIHVVLFDLIEFKTFPPLKMRKPDGTKWETISEKLRENVFCQTIFDEEKKNEHAYHQNYIAFFSPLDPQFYDNLQV